MGRISALESITLDGVMQGGGRPDEDTRDRTYDDVLAYWTSTPVS